MDKITPEVGKNSKGEEVYMFKPNDFAQLIQRAMKAGAAAPKGEAPQSPAQGAPATQEG